MKGIPHGGCWHPECKECFPPHKTPRTRYKFIGRDGRGNYVWESVLPLLGDSRYEQITCSPAWFWGKHPIPIWCMGRYPVSKP